MFVPETSRVSPRRFGSGYAPDSAVTFFCFAKRKSPKKRRADVRAASRFLALLAPLGVWLNSLRSDNASPYPSAAPLLSPASTAGKSSILNIRKPLQRMRCGLSPAVMRRRVAQRRADQGRRCLGYWGQTPISLRHFVPHPEGEPKARRIWALTPKTHPARIEQRSVLAQPGDESGSPSLCLLSLGEARESESPAGARPGLSVCKQDVKKRTLK